MPIPVIFTLLLALFLSSSVQSQTRCQCSYQDWQGDCRASIEQSGSWFKVISDTQQCSRVDWFINGEPNVTIVTDGADMVEWLGQSQSPSIAVQSCKICRDTEMSVSEASGQCSYSFPSFFKEVGVYEGECRNGIAHGSGRISFPSGGYMEGEFVDGQANGYGEHIYASGARYEGNYRGNERRGTGVYYFPDGHRYRGEFDVLPNGNGIYYGDGWREEGYFRDHVLINGTIFLPDGRACRVTSGRRERGC